MSEGIIHTFAWIVAFNGSFAIQGEWQTKEECRVEAPKVIQRMIDKYGLQALPNEWKCIRQEYIQDNRTIEQREVR